MMILDSGLHFGGHPVQDFCRCFGF